MRRSDGGLGPLGFLILMLGLGLRLDSSWQGLAGVLIAIGVALGGVGLLRRRAFVPPGVER